MSRSSGRRLKNYAPKDPYRGREYEDDPRAAPPMPMRRLAIETASGCGSSAAMCAESSAHSRDGYRSPFGGQRLMRSTSAARGLVSPRAHAP